MGVGKEGDPIPTIQTDHHHAVCYGILVNCGQMGMNNGDECSQTLGVCHEAGVAYGMTMDATKGFPMTKETSQTLMQGTCPGHKNAVILAPCIVRRLLPVETERLMGFPPTLEARIGKMTKDEFIAWEIAVGNIRVDTEHGKVYSMRTGGGNRCEPRLLEGTELNGYYVVSLREKSIKYQCRVHRIVWIAAHGIPEDGMVVDHINNNKKDNRLCNLQLLTPAENSHKAYEDGLYLFGEDNAASKITNAQRDEIVQIRLATGETFERIGKLFGLKKCRTAEIFRKTDHTAPQFSPERIKELTPYFIEKFAEWDVINGKDPAKVKRKTEAQVRKWLSAMGTPDQPDAPRYKAAGNSMCTNCMEWIGRRIDMVLEEDSANESA